MKKKNDIIIPEGLHEVLLHACCAPCSSAIVEWMLQHDIRPTIFYYNPNIYPREEYEIRKNESKRHAESLNIPWIDGDYDHEAWLTQMAGLEHEPERGSRCERCFRSRLLATALKAQELGIPYFATTLASSRWKNLDQINRAGIQAQQALASSPSVPHDATLSHSPAAPSSPSVLYDATLSHPSATSSSVLYDATLSHPSAAPSSPLFWPQNWRKGGLQDRRNQLLHEYAFYNQQYCGCEFSIRPTTPPSSPSCPQ